MLTALGASQVQAQGAGFGDPQPPPGATTPVAAGGNLIDLRSACGAPVISITATASTVLTVVQGAPAAARTFSLGMPSQRASCYLIDYRVDARGAGNDLKIGQDAARDYMGLTLRISPANLLFGDNPPLEEGALTARLGSDTSNVFQNGFGNYPDGAVSLNRIRPITVASERPSAMLELELSPGPDIFTEGSVSRVQAACDSFQFVVDSCAVASQVFELRVIPALSDDVAFAAFNDDTDTPPDHYIATGVLYFKLALPNNLNLYEVAYEVRAEVIAGANTGTTFTESLVPGTPDGVVGLELPAALGAGDIIAIDAVATVQAEATHKRLSGHFLVTVVNNTSSINDDNSLDEEIVVVAPHRVMPGVYALAAGETQSARISTPTAVIIPGMPTPDNHIPGTGVFNFTVTGLDLPEASSRADVVITLSTPLTTTAIPHKYAMGTDTTTATWNVFDTLEGDDGLPGDNWYGAAMTGGACPAANSDTWKPEMLEANDQCLRVTLTDGGANDADRVRNGVIHDPIALVVKRDPDDDPSAPKGGGGANDADRVRNGVIHDPIALVVKRDPDDDPSAPKGGGGAMHWLWLLLLTGLTLTGLRRLQAVRRHR